MEDKENEKFCNLTKSVELLEMELHPICRIKLISQIKIKLA